MKNLTYKIKSTLYSYTKEGKKLKRPTYYELIKYENFLREKKNQLVLSFGSGRSGQNWISKIFNSHKNWIGSAERFADYEAFYRYITYYDLPISKDGFFRLLDLSINRDMALYQNSFISSPYWSFGVKETLDKLKPDYLIYSIRNPIKNIKSFHRKGWYLNLDKYEDLKSPMIDIVNSQYRSFSRIIPKGEYLNEWKKLTRIGKITWFWCTINNSIYNDFQNTNNIEKYILRLEDINDNYDMYEKLAKKFNFEKKLNKRSFLNIVNKAPNKGKIDKYFYNEWNDREKKEFENIINKYFPYYDQMKTNL